MQTEQYAFMYLGIYIYKHMHVYMCAYIHTYLKIILELDRK